MPIRHRAKASTVSRVTQGSHGSVAINDDGTVTYTPTTGFTGSDSFTYTVEDTDSNTATATIDVNVSPVISTTPPRRWRLPRIVPSP